MWWNALVSKLRKSDSPRTYDTCRLHHSDMLTPTEGIGKTISTWAHRSALVSSAVARIPQSYTNKHLQGIVNLKDTELAYIYLSYNDAELRNTLNLPECLVCQLIFSQQSSLENKAPPVIPYLPSTRDRDHSLVLPCEGDWWSLSDFHHEWWNTSTALCNWRFKTR